MNVKLVDYEQIIRHNSETTTLKMRDRILWWEKSNGADGEALIVRRWLEASGTITFDCSTSPGGPFLTLSVTAAIAGGLSTLWGFFYDQHFAISSWPSVRFPFRGDFQ